jgi:hypothetical protein
MLLITTLGKQISTRTVTEKLQIKDSLETLNIFNIHVKLSRFDLKLLHTWSTYSCVNKYLDKHVMKTKNTTHKILMKRHSGYRYVETCIYLPHTQFLWSSHIAIHQNIKVKNESELFRYSLESYNQTDPSHLALLRPFWLALEI